MVGSPRSRPLSRTTHFDLNTRGSNIPHVKVVMPTRTATLLTPHSADICATPGVYEPAAYAVRAVIAHAIHIVKFFLFSVQSNGFVYLTRFGGSGGGACSLSFVGCRNSVGWGSSVSQVKYLQTISSLLGFMRASTSVKSSSRSSYLSLSISLLLLDAGSELRREWMSGYVVISG